MMANISKPPTNGPQEDRAEKNQREDLETALNKLPKEFLKNLEKSTGSKDFTEMYKKGFSSKELGEKTEKALFSLVRSLMGMPVDEQDKAAGLNPSSSENSSSSKNNNVTEDAPEGGKTGLTDLHILSNQKEILGSQKGALDKQKGISADQLSTSSQSKKEEPLSTLLNPSTLDQFALQVPGKGLKDTGTLSARKESQSGVLQSGTLPGVEGLSGKQMSMDASNDRSVSSSAHSSQTRADALKAEIQSLMNKLLTFVSGHTVTSKGLHQLRIPLPSALSAQGSGVTKSAEMLVQLEGKEVRIQFKGAAAEAQQWLQTRLAELQLRPGLREFHVQVQWAASTHAVPSDNAPNSVLSHQAQSRTLSDTMTDPHQFQDERKQKNPYDEDDLESEDEQ